MSEGKCIVIRVFIDEFTLEPVWVGSSWRVVLLHFSSSINESGHRRIAAATRVTAWWCGAVTSVAAAILPMGCRVDWTSKGQQNNKPMMNRRKLIPKWKSQYTSQLFTFPSNLVGNFILVFKFLTNDTTKFKVAWSCQNVKTILLFSIDKVPLNSLLSHSVQRHLSIFKLRRVQM